MISIQTVKFAAQMRNEPDIDDKWLIKAGELIDSNQVEVDRYPMGHPTAKAVWDLAVKLMQQSNN